MDAIPLEKIGDAIAGLIEEIKRGRSLLKSGGIADIALPGEMNPKDVIQLSFQVIVSGGTNALTRTQDQETFGAVVTEQVEDAFEVTRTQQPVVNTEVQAPSENIVTSDEATSSESSTQNTRQDQYSATSGGNVSETTIDFE